MFSASKTKGAGGFQIANSLRFRSSASAYLNRTPGSASNRKTWTFSAWVKRGALGSAHSFFGGWDNSTGATDIGTAIRFNADALDVFDYTNATYNFQLTTTSVFRDPSSWYHVVIAFDTTQATASNRIKVYVNGSQITSFSTATYPNQNTDWKINNTVVQSVGCIGVDNAASQFFDGYLAEINFIDGQALTPSAFGMFDAASGVWKPTVYGGTYGTNGFKLNFSNGTSTTTLGYDSSGNSNNWTTNNISLTAGTTYDWMLDSPTPLVGTSYGVGNYAVLNPLTGTNSAASYLSAGNLTFYNASNTSNWKDLKATTAIAYGSSKYYWEATVQYTPSGAVGNQLGVVQTNANLTSDLGTYCLYWNNVNYIIGATTYSAPALNDVLQVAYDAVTGQLWFGKNNTWFAGNPSAGTGASFTGITTDMVPAVAGYSISGPTGCILNFGQRPLAYTPPSGFQSLCTQNISAGTVITSGSFTGNVSTDGPFVWLNGTPTAMTINGNAVTFGTHADKLANGFKVRSSSSSYNASGPNTFSITTNSGVFKTQIAQPNP